MTNDDLSPLDAPSARFGSPFSRWVTLVLGVLIAMFFAVLLAPQPPEDRVRALERPVDSVTRYFERNLEVADAIATLPSWLGRGVEVVFDSSDDLREAIRAYREVLSVGTRASASSVSSSHDEHSTPIDGSDRDAESRDEAKLAELRARLAILLEESNLSDDAREELTVLESSGRGAVAAAVRTAYGERAIDSSANDAAAELARFAPGWARDHARMKLAVRSGDVATKQQLARETDARDVRWRAVALLIAFLFAVPAAIGLVFFVAWLWRDRPRVVLADARIPPAWSWGDGCAVLVRSAAAGLVIGSALLFAAREYERSEIAAWTELIASLPMLWWIQRALLAPHGLDFATAFGLRASKRASSSDAPSLAPLDARENTRTSTNATTRARTFGAWIAFVLGLIAIDQFGTSAIAVLCRRIGLEPHWTEAVHESSMWLPASRTLIDAVDTAVWAPLFEEIGCRGLLYATLRTRFGTQSAAITSGVLFAIPHAYSLPGFLSVAWTGYVFAIAFELCGSLIPGMICHALWNSTLLASAFAMYR
jgi:membrane protease YdiL (CAAX protease family)